MGSSRTVKPMWTLPLHKDDIEALLRQYGISPTQQRVEIACILFARPQHLSAEQVLHLVNDEKPIVSKATVYNTLGLFARKGLIREVIVDPTKVFYDPTTVPHHHFYNVDTGTLMDIPADAVALGAQPAQPNNPQQGGGAGGGRGEIKNQNKNNFLLKKISFFFPFFSPLSLCSGGGGAPAARRGGGGGGGGGGAT